jgi:hypothetical protein
MTDAAEMLWVVLSNVSDGDWTKQSSEWQEAAARWRDHYFAAITAQATHFARVEAELRIRARAEWPHLEPDRKPEVSHPDDTQDPERIAAREAARRFMDDGSPSGPDEHRMVSIAEIEQFAADLLAKQAARLAQLEAERDSLKQYNGERIQLQDAWRARADAAEARLAQLEATPKVDVLDALHDVFTRHGIVSRQDYSYDLISDLVSWAAAMCRQSSQPKRTGDYYVPAPLADSPLRHVYTLAMAQLEESRDQWKREAEQETARADALESQLAQLQKAQPMK